MSDLGGGKFIPAERHKTLYADDAIPRRANYGKPPEGKPALLRHIDDLPPLGPNTVTDDETIRNRLRMLASADEGLGKMFAVLEAQKQLDNTLIIFTSDEGYFYGEHGLSIERRLAYEESICNPLLLRYPKLIKAGSVLDQFVLSIDVAPTLLAIGGAPAAPDMHGRSLLPLLQGKKGPWRESLLIEHASDKVFPRVVNLGYQVVRTDRWKLIHYVDLEGMDELYDLHSDAFEMNNLIGAPGAQAPLKDLKAELQRLLKDSQ